MYVYQLLRCTFDRLKFQSVSSLVVWSGGSNATVYGDPAINHAFRAWHDSLHLKLGLDFSLESEIAVATEQSRLLHNDGLARLIMAEVKGQAEYFAKHSQFPDNQVEFVTNYLKAN